MLCGGSLVGPATSEVSDFGGPSCQREGVLVALLWPGASGLSALQEGVHVALLGAGTLCPVS